MLAPLSHALLSRAFPQDDRIVIPRGATPGRDKVLTHSVRPAFRGRAGLRRPRRRSIASTMTDEKSPLMNHNRKPNKGGVSVGILAAFLILLGLGIVLSVKIQRRDSQVADLQEQLADATSQAAKAQADLDKASSGTESLKAQIAKAAAGADDLKAQIAQDRLAATQQQDQIDKGRAQKADLQSRLDMSETQSAAFKSQLDQETAGSARMLTELDQSKIQALDLQGRLQKAEDDLAQLQPLLVKARHMPVTTSFERTHGDRLTLHVNNLDRQPLTVSVTVDEAGKTRSQSTVIGSGASLNVEKLQAGDGVTVACDGYDTLKLTAQ